LFSEAALGIRSRKIIRTFIRFGKPPIAHHMTLRLGRSHNIKPQYRFGMVSSHPEMDTVLPLLNPKREKDAYVLSVLRCPEIHGTADLSHPPIQKVTAKIESDVRVICVSVPRCPEIQTKSIAMI
jgi:hypothetical protein